MVTIHVIMKCFQMARVSICESGDLEGFGMLTPKLPHTFQGTSQKGPCEDALMSLWRGMCISRLLVSLEKYRGVRVHFYKVSCSDLTEANSK